jgi:hypothetical protein
MKELEIELSNIPNDKYKKFFARFEEIKTLPVEQWKVVHLLAYFCQKYRQTYQTEYTWKFNHQSPSKCFEVWQISSLSSKLSSNPVILKEYIDWAFETLIPKAKRKLTSISFMTKDEVVNPYKMLLLSGKNPRQANITRTTLLPETFVAIIRNNGFNAATYGDLAFLSQMYQDERWLQMFQQLTSSGFNQQLLIEIV